MAGKVWFITGTSKGFGRVWAEAALARGDKVAATARDVKTLEPLVKTYGDRVLALRLDVTNRQEVAESLASAHQRFGRLDIVVNNAGYGLFGAIEEISEAEARAQIETNLFGALWVTQAALPLLRARRAGHILQVSSVGGVGAFPNIGIYHASKWGLEGLSEALAQEVAAFGIKVTLVEPSGFSTDWAGASAKNAAPLAAYEPARAAMIERRKLSPQADPRGTVKAILQLVDAPDPPLRLLLGSAAVRIANALYPQRLATWKSWEAVSIAADKP
jgi:NAD(P)-dependent dehydrogenase (short-subunit alcohol dehydrogenase family)